MDNLSLLEEINLTKNISIAEDGALTKVKIEVLNILYVG